jgi:hypothetical protein
MADVPVSPYSFDHVILLLDTPDFENPPEWLTKNFTIIEGGTHAGEFDCATLFCLPCPALLCSPLNAFSESEAA